MLENTESIGGGHPLSELMSPMSAYPLSDVKSKVCGGNLAKYTPHKVKETESGEEVDDDLFNRLFAYVADIKITKKQTRRTKPSVGNKTRKSR
jgi:hypothetical protein